MGCNTSKHKSKDADVSSQQRRLSVAPGQVESKEDESQDGGKDAVIISVQNETGMLASGTIAHAYKSKKGIVPYNRDKCNQDRGVIAYGLQGNEDMALWGVMDGHGEFGHVVASFIQENLPSCVSRQSALREAPEQSLTRAVKLLCDELADTSINVSFSGSTLVFGVKIADMLYVSNTGDSRCIVCRQTATGDLQAIGLSIDQKPDNPKEKARILKAGGRVEPLPGPPGEDCGPPRVWLAEVDVPGLAMARSIGDEVSQTVGVISVPEIIPHHLQRNDIFAVWVTDGATEWLSNEQIIALVWKYKHDLRLAAEQLVEEAAKLWRKEEEVIDDVTCVIAMFNQPQST